MSMTNSDLLNMKLLLQVMLEKIESALGNADPIPMEEAIVSLRSDGVKHVNVAVRHWKTAQNERKEAWRVDWRDVVGKRQRRQFESREAAERFKLMVQNDEVV